MGTLELLLERRPGLPHGDGGDWGDWMWGTEKEEEKYLLGVV